MSRQLLALCATATLGLYAVAVPFVIGLSAATKVDASHRQIGVREELAHVQLVREKPRFSEFRIAPVALKPQQQRIAGAAPLDTVAEQRALAREIQRDLIRVGCYAGEVSGTWDAATKAALTAFLSHHNSDLPTDGPDVVVWALLDRHNGPTCAPPCPNQDATAACTRLAPVQEAALAQSPFSRRIHRMIHLVTAATSGILMPQAQAGADHASASPSTSSAPADPLADRTAHGPRPVTVRVATPARPERQRSHVTTSAERTTGTRDTLAIPTVPQLQRREPPAEPRAREALSREHADTPSKGFAAAFNSSRNLEIR